jgi:transposase
VPTASARYKYASHSSSVFSYFCRFCYVRGADWIRALASDQGAWANIPPKRNRKEAICFSPYLYRARNLVERFFNKIKQCRRIATRYDRLAANYLASIKLASIRIRLRVYESAS